MTTDLDSDRALEDEENDQFGFVGMAERLAPSIIQAAKGDGMVIGLEGRWGSGKTSLLNFLRVELDSAKGEAIYTITIAPWLNGDSSSLVSSLLEPMAAILKNREKELEEVDGEQSNLTKDKVAGFYPVTADIPKKRHNVPKECSCPDAENIAQSSNAKPLL